ncbi:hypothetical protein QK289_15555 [Exiguobacterium antarcticum]|uniref:Uncharacterized protein n=1 Tax=Exiguobacterium antarcticum TaxID=132920 RepID=A0ABT6R662_9BACL|nr:hypothetical protein [Exiguobacterium antarcticum]MDI3236431.1 hypothetical protein [Exiguobacterium antarcticum]
MVLFKRLSFSQISQKLSESTLQLGVSSLSSFDFDFEESPAYVFERDMLIEKHQGTMTLYKKDGASQSFQMTREAFYPLNRNQLGRMQPAYEVLMKEGYGGSIGKIYDSHLGVENSMLELINKFHDELLLVKEMKMVDFLFTYDDETHTDMAKFMLFGVGGVEESVHTTLSNKYI